MNVLVRAQGFADARQVEVQELIAMSKSPDCQTRITAATRLAELGTPLADEVLRVLLDDENTAVIAAAADALWLRGDALAAETLLAAIADANADVGNDHMDAMREALNVHSVPVIDLCLFTLTRSPDVRARCGAAEALGWLGVEEARPVLSQVVQSRTPSVSAAAAEAIAMLDYYQRLNHRG